MKKKIIETSESLNQKIICHIDEKCQDANSPVRFAIERYKTNIEIAENPEDFLRNLTSYFTAAKDESIALCSDKWKQGKASSLKNALTCVAGNNYQSLVKYALATHFLETSSNWYVYKTVKQKNIVEVTYEADKVKPDMDILLGNTKFINLNPEPIVVLGAKTSVKDRGAGASLWKLILEGRLSDIYTVKTKYKFIVFIINANLHDELECNQCISNTAVFKRGYKYSTNEDYKSAKGWLNLINLPIALKDIESRFCGLIQMPS